jgi:hypothetical protein
VSGETGKSLLSVKAYFLDKAERERENGSRHIGQTLQQKSPLSSKTYQLNLKIILMF